MEDKKRKAQEAYEHGGLLTEEFGDGIKVHLAVDATKPELIFDKLNEFEVELVHRAGNDLEKVKKAGEFVDELRAKTREMLKQNNIRVP